MRLVLALLVVVTSACATTSSNPSTSGRASDYYPLAVGNAWSYRVTPGPEEPQVLSIVQRNDDGFFVDNHGGVLAPRNDGLFDGKRFVLQEPLVVDHVWTALPKDEAQESYKIVATDAVVTVPAGTYEGVVVVDGEQPGRDPNTGKPGKLLVRWSYAKHVGMVKVEVRMQLEKQAPVLITTMELTSFTAAPAAAGPSGPSG